MSQARILTRTLTAAAVAATLAACSGGHSGVLPSAPAHSQPAAHSAKATFVVKIPAAKTSSSRSRHFISPSTKSIGFNYIITGSDVQHQEQYADVTPGSQGCVTDSNTGATTCTLTFGAQAGDIYYTIKAYDGTGGTGNMIGYADATMTVVANQDNSFDITLDGVAAKLEMTLAQSSVPAGTPVDIPVAISAYDADNNLILASPDGYALSLGGVAKTGVLTSSDDTEFSLLQNGQQIPVNINEQSQHDLSAPYSGIAVHYNGGIRKDGTINFTTAGLTAQATLKVTAPTSTASLAYISWYYFGQFGGVDSSAVTAFPAGASATLNGGVDYFVDGTDNSGCSSAGNRVQFYSALTTDNNGNVAFVSTPPCSTDLPAIVAYTPGQTGQGPAWAITQIAGVVSIGFDGTNAPYVYVDEGSESVNGVTVSDVGQIRVLQPFSSGPYSPAMVARTIDYVDFPEAILVAADGTVYAAHVGDQGGNTGLEAIDVFAPGASGSATPERYIGGGTTGLNHISQMALDSQGNLYVANHGDGTNGTLTVYAPNANGDVAPIRTISGSEVSNVTGIGIDPFDNLYAVSGAQFAVYGPGASAPTRTFGTGFSSSNGPMALLK